MSAGATPNLTTSRLPAYLGDNRGVATEHQQCLYGGDVSLHRGEQQRRLAFLVGRVWVGADGGEELHHRAKARHCAREHPTVGLIEGAHRSPSAWG